MLRAFYPNIASKRGYLIDDATFAQAYAVNYTGFSEAQSVFDLVPNYF